MPSYIKQQQTPYPSILYNVSLRSRPHNLSVRSQNFVKIKQGVHYNIRLGTATVLSANVKMVAIGIQARNYENVPFLL
jgi:uncharacterized RmlC-like cupin family protein